MAVFNARVDDFLFINDAKLVPATGKVLVPIYDPNTGKVSTTRLDVSEEGEKGVAKAIDAAAAKIVAAQSELQTLVDKHAELRRPKRGKSKDAAAVGADDNEASSSPTGP